MSDKFCGGRDRLGDNLHPMSISRAPLLRFGAFEMDVRSGELRRGGVRVKLQRQPFKVLELLAVRAGDVVTRQEIERELWGDQTHVDFEGGLNYCIKQIRAVLEDDAAAPRFIETLPRRGYRLVTHVEKQDRASRNSHRPMLAILPFGNLTGQSDQDYFTDGLTEELIAQLGRLNAAQLGVIAFTTARQYKDTSKGIDEIGQELNVDFIVEGSVRRAGDRVRITAQLIRVSDQSHLWAEAYNHTLDDIISIQIDVAERVARSLAVGLLANHQAAMTRVATRDSAAYDAYLRGRYYWNLRTEEGFIKALGCFQSAIEKDPGYVAAYVGLADVYVIIGFYSGLPPRQASAEARRAIGKALELDGSSAEAHTSLAYAKLLYEWDFAGAETNFRQALDLNPNQVTGHYWYALFLAAMGRFDEAFQHIRDALEMDPLSLVINCHKGWILYFARRYDEGADQLRNTLDMEPNFSLARYFLGLVLAQGGKYEEAGVEFRKAKEVTDGHPASISGLAAAAALTGKRGEARRLLKKLEDLSGRRYVTPYYLALVHVALGNIDRAFECLEKAYEERSGYMTNLKNDPALDSLRSDPRFDALMRRVGLP